MKTAPLKLLYRVSPAMWRRFMHAWPPIRNTGGRIVHISKDFRSWDLKLPLNRRTRNLVGTHFGGTLYSAMDAPFMLAWIRVLGPDYIVWDKGATIRFRRPGRTALDGRIRITQDMVDDVLARAEMEPKFDLSFKFQWTDTDGEVVAEVDKLLHFRKKASDEKEPGA